MSRTTSIEWTDTTWNPLRGCSRVSEGCRNCYAERIAARFSKPGQPFHGVAKVIAPRDSLDAVGGRRNGWNGKVELVEEKLAEPLRWRTPRRVFVNSMSDLFHEKVPDEWIDRVFAVMADARRHTFQILTKRPERMRTYLAQEHRRREWIAGWVKGNHLVQAASMATHLQAWPLPNVWLGVSVEDQATADARIPLLLQTPAAMRFASYEPALGPVDFEPFVTHEHPCIRFYNTAREKKLGACACRGTLDWIIVGGESGPGARPFDVAWARQTIAQCRAADVACFVKQLGAVALQKIAPGCDELLDLRDRKGGDMAEWPADLRVREFPR